MLTIISLKYSKAGEYLSGLHLFQSSPMLFLFMHLMACSEMGGGGGGGGEVLTIELKA